MAERRGDLALHRVHKRFGNTEAIKDLDLAVAPGEMVALLGPSGCGKTTTLRIVAGFETPDRGAVWLRGADATGLPPHRRDVGVVFQNYALFPHMTVRENIAYGLRRRRVTGSALLGRVEDALAMVHLDGLGERYPNQLSGGQQQRVAVARAVVIRPSILLFDEPLSNLDAKLRQAMRSELRALQRRLGITALFVTHDQEEALALADRIAVMHAGVVEQIGSGEEIYRRPANRFVATFIGECNFLEGRVSADGLRFEAAGAAAPLAQRSAGGEATLALRPEDLRLCGAAALLQGPAFAGRIEEVTYLGARFQYRVGLSRGASLLIAAPHDVQHAVGEAVTVTWSPADAVLYPGAG